MRRPIALIALLLAALGLVSVPAAGAGGGEQPAAAGPAAVPGELLVTYRAGADADTRTVARGRVGATRVERVVRARGARSEVELVHLPAGADRAAAARRLAADPDVLAAEPNWIYTTGATSTDPYYTNGSLWGMYGDATTPANQYGSQAGEAWAADHTGSDAVYVGVIDEGIQVTHPDLDGNVWVNPFDPVDGVDNDGNGYVDDTNGWDFVNRDRTVYDGGNRGKTDTHGTHVAGTIGAESNGTGVVGVNWNVTLISGKFLGQKGGTTANAIKAVDYMTDLKTRHGLNLVATSNSWGGGPFSQSLLDAIVRGANAGILFVAAAGNGGLDGIGDNNDVVPHYPANYNTSSGAGYDAVISVAAIANNGSKATFSNFGSTTVDLGAPGVGTWSTYPFNRYQALSGTSMATPHVSGGVALYASTHPGATAASIRAAVLGSVVPTSSLSGITVTGGRLDVSGF